MHVIASTRLPDVRFILPEVNADFRGEFLQTYRRDQYRFEDHDGQLLEFVEDDISLSRQSVLRGLHGDWQTWKLVQCLYGETYFVLVDMRSNSPTYLQHDSLVLNDWQRRQVLIPAGFAIGLLVLSERCVFAYKQSRYYSGAQHQFTVRWDDPKLNLYWPVLNPILSQRDSTAPFLP